MVATGSFGMPDDDPRPSPTPTNPQGPPGRFSDDLIGLDPNDPEARAFAEHLDRVERVRPGYTVEGYIGGVGDFADAANRLGGHRRLTAGILVGLILLGVLIAVWDTLVFILTTLFG
ncbi:MAG TPA: hypothetical protein VM677_15135 [Actinokineospora sp.]|nr:hypothetical protein [Actinokineospora sp.]